VFQRQGKESRLGLVLQDVGLQDVGLQDVGLQDVGLQDVAIVGLKEVGLNDLVDVLANFVVADVIHLTLHVALLAGIVRLNATGSRLSSPASNACMTEAKAVRT
jgi:hypothetical protein